MSAILERERSGHLLEVGLVGHDVIAVIPLRAPASPPLGLFVPDFVSFFSPGLLWESLECLDILQPFSTFELKWGGKKTDSKLHEPYWGVNQRGVWLAEVWLFQMKHSRVIQFFLEEIYHLVASKSFQLGSGTKKHCKCGRSRRHTFLLDVGDYQPVFCFVRDHAWTW